MARNGNGNLHDSARNKQDEFYTNLQLIEDELKHYRAHFRGKRILCNCDDLWTYFEAVVAWVGETFPNTRVKLMKGLPWGIYYNRFGHVPRDAAALEARIAQLLRDDEDVGDITNQRGIYEYLLDGDERHLSIRAFSPKMARTAYERQKGVCPICGKHFAIEDMQADHIVPWSKGGRTTADNCQMLCKADNLRKSAT